MVVNTQRAGVRVVTDFAKIGTNIKRNTIKKLKQASVYIRNKARFKIKRSPIRRWKKLGGGWVGGKRRPFSHNRFRSDLALEAVRNRAGQVIYRNGNVLLAPVLLNRDQTRAKPGQPPLTHVHDVRPDGGRQSSKGIKRSILSIPDTSVDSVVIGTSKPGVGVVGGVLEFGQGNHADHPFMEPALTESEQFLRNQFANLL